MSAGNRANSDGLRFAIVGSAGQLGAEFVRALGDRGIAFPHSRLDLTVAADALEQALAAARPDIVVNTAAFNFVDAAETDHTSALRLNFLAPLNLARIAEKRGWRLLHFSTDYVFGGEAQTHPYVESDRPAPVNFYGITKLMGEQAVLRASPNALVCRVAHLFGGASNSPARSNLVLRFLERGRGGETIKASSAQMLNPTSVQDIVPACLRLLDSQKTGLYHLTGAGQCTVFDFASEVLRLAGLKAPLEDAADTRPAPRPRYTVLDNRRLKSEGFPDLPDWKVSLRSYLRQLGYSSLER